MHNISKKTVQDLAAELVELCIHADPQKIKNKAKAIYEQSVLLAYMEQPDTATKTQVTPVDTPENKVADDKTDAQKVFEQLMKNRQEYQKEKPVEKIETPHLDESDLASKSGKLPTTSVEDEFKDTISADVAAELFERADHSQSTKKSLNDRLSQKQIQVGLNDRIGFVKHLFDGSVEDFNRVLSQLNTFSKEQEAKDFMETHVLPDYDWSDKEEYVVRFYKLIETKFL
ncbi:MAG: hypothetical protein CR968_02620 [Flavobacteriia bacterium]|nr:MAG: hypothetical protein CR968_02620 [Flavobacteriia bacterium]